MRYFAAISLFIFSAVFSNSYAQKELRFGTNMLASDNIFRNYAKQGDVVYMPFTGIGYQISPEENGKLYFGYEGNFYLFRQLSYRDFSVHRLSADYNYLWPETKSLLALGGKVETRFDPENYEFYDYTTGGFYLNYKRYFSQNLVLLARYNLTGKDFSQFYEFNFSEHIFDLQANIYLPTRTTVSLESTFYLKNFTSGVVSIDTVFVSFEEMSEFIPVYTYYNIYRYLGLEKYKDMHVSGFYRDMGEGYYKYVGNGFHRYDSKFNSFPNTDQLKLRISVAQNLAEGTGLMLAYAGRINPHNHNRFLSNLGESVVNDEELFDDHYSHVGHEGRIQIRRILPDESCLTFRLTGRKRKFSGRPAMDLAGKFLPGGESRCDRTLIFELVFNKPIALGSHPLLNGLNFSIQAGSGKNRSNDEYYDYSSSYFMMALEKLFD